VPENSSFRGLSLNMKADEAREMVQRLGFHLVGMPRSTAMDICNGKEGVGTIRFDPRGNIRKLELSPEYFLVDKIVLREFADGVFEHYRVRPAKVPDDVCYHDVTCFRGTTRAERFLIVRIAGDTQLHVSQRRTGLTQGHNEGW
jgi:hypothetical protein